MSNLNELVGMPVNMLDGEERHREYTRIKAAIKSVIPNAHVYGSFGDVRFDVTTSREIDYDTLARLAEAIGTRNINVISEYDDGYSELTPGDGPFLTVQVK